jgi:hypothetical protein
MEVNFHEHSKKLARDARHVLKKQLQPQLLALTNRVIATIRIRQVVISVSLVVLVLLVYQLC